MYCIGPTRSGDVLFFDIHCAAPFYPGSGNLEEVGGGLGEGYTVNVPVPSDAGDVPELVESGLREVMEAAEFHGNAFTDDD